MWRGPLKAGSTTTSTNANNSGQLTRIGSVSAALNTPTPMMREFARRYCGSWLNAHAPSGGERFHIEDATGGLRKWEVNESAAAAAAEAQASALQIKDSSDNAGDSTSAVAAAAAPRPLLKLQQLVQEKMNKETRCLELWVVLCDAGAKPAVVAAAVHEHSFSEAAVDGGSTAPVAAESAMVPEEQLLSEGQLLPLRLPKKRVRNKYTQALLRTLNVDDVLGGTAGGPQLEEDQLEQLQQQQAELAAAAAADEERLAEAQENRQGGGSSFVPSLRVLIARARAEDPDDFDT
jgi:hypothetical protein